MDFKLGKNSVLIIDNVLEDRDFLADVLIDEYDIYKESDAESAIAAAKSLEPDVILLNVRMEEEGGVMAALRDSYETQNIPVIILLEADSLEDEEGDFLIGAVDYIQKPLPPVVVKSRVRNHMRLVNQKRVLDQLDEIDSLTDTFSPKFFRNRLNQEWRRAMRDNTPLSILVVGLCPDQRADEDIVKNIAIVIKNNIKRAMDIAAYWGDGVFAVLLPNTPAYGADIVAEIIRISIEKTPIVKEDEGTVYAEAVICVNCAKPEFGSSGEELFAHTFEMLKGLAGSEKNIVYSLVDKING